MRAVAVSRIQINLGRVLCSIVVSETTAIRGFQGPDP
jgi:hypothetical protein